MTCMRCHGMMVRDRLLDEVGRATCSIWRCVACGEILDPVILINRVRQPLGRRLRGPRLVLWVRPFH